MFKRVLPVRTFQYIILTSVCDHGYVSDWASAMKSLLSEKIFWGGAGNVGNLKAYTEKYMIGGTREIEKGNASSVSFFIHTVRTVRVP